MTPQAQRIALAEWSGFKRVTTLFSGQLSGLMPPTRGWIEIPDYLHDLNAMYAAEAGLLGHQMIRYQAELSSITTKNPHVSCWDLIHASADQRAEALLKTIGKWENEKAPSEDLCVLETIRVTQRMDREKFLAAKPKKELGW